MKSYVFLLSIVSVVFGRPEPPSPYQYNALSVSYGSPSKDSYDFPSPKDSYGYSQPSSHNYDSYSSPPSDSYSNHLPSDSYSNHLPRDSYGGHTPSYGYSAHPPSYSHGTHQPSYSYGIHPLSHSHAAHAESDTYGAPHHDSHPLSYSHGPHTQRGTYGAPDHYSHGAHPPSYSHGNHAPHHTYGAPHHDSHFAHPLSDTYGLPHYDNYGIPKYGVPSYNNYTTFNTTFRNLFRNSTGPLDGESFIVDIVPNVDGVTNFTMDQIMMLIDSLNMTLFNDPDFARLRFESALPDRGVLRVVAADRFTRDWLLRVVPTLEGLWPNRMIRAVSVGSSPRTITATIMMTVPVMDPETFFTVLGMQNSIDTSNWRLISRGRTQQGMQLWTIAIDERSVPALRAVNFRPFVGLSRVTISVFNNQNQINNQLIFGPGNGQQIFGPGNGQPIFGPGNAQQIFGPGNGQAIFGPGNGPNFG